MKRTIQQNDEIKKNEQEASEEGLTNLLLVLGFFLVSGIPTTHKFIKVGSQTEKNPFIFPNLNIFSFEHSKGTDYILKEKLFGFSNVYHYTLSLYSCLS